MVRQTGNDSAPQSGRRYQGKSQKKGWHHAVSRGMTKLFRVLRKILELVTELFEHVLNLLGSMFELGSKFWTSPYTHYIASILLFLVIMAFALWQWAEMGAWAGKFFKAKYLGSLIGFTAGVLLNLYQLSPMLWKLDKRITRAYAKAKINPNFEAEEEETPSERIQNWSSHAHQALKARSASSYMIEWAVYLFYWIVALRYSPLGLFQGLVALKFPEWTLSLALHNQEIMKQTLQEIEESEDSVQSNINL
jgi:hypothetical protein